MLQKMKMIQTINQSQFIDAMTFPTDSSYNNCFSLEGKIALFNYLEQLEEESEIQIELDPIALCCDYSEYNNLEDILSEYTSIKDRQDLENNTTIIDCDNGHIIIAAF